MMDESSRSVRTRRFRTLRWKLTLLATAVVALVLTASAVGLAVVQQRLLTHGIDESLVQRADNIEADLSQGVLGGRLPAEGDPEDLFMQLLAPNGDVVRASPNATGLSPVSGPLRPAPRQVLRSVSGVRGTDDFRILMRSIESESGTNTLVVAKNLDDVNESVRILVSSLAIAIPTVTILLAILLWWLTGRILRPVESIRAEVASIQGTELHRRVPVPRSDDEISRLAHTMNAMLERVEEATGRQQRFVADASHELRGPLTRLRSELEVAMAHPETSDPRAMYPSLLSDTIELNELVDDLLFLARSESGAFSRPAVAVDLDDLVLDEARRLKERGSVQVNASAVSAARALGDSQQLSRAIRNLASNAERHAASCVTFALREYDEKVELVVADDGPGIPPEHHAEVFKRFTRLDEARSRDAGGAGLGLAIVHDIVTRHDGTIEIAAQNGGGARFLLTLPRGD